MNIPRIFLSTVRLISVCTTRSCISTTTHEHGVRLFFHISTLRLAKCAGGGTLHISEEPSRYLPRFVKNERPLGDGAESGSVHQWLSLGKSNLSFYFLLGCY